MKDIVFIGGIFPEGHTQALEKKGIIPSQIAFDVLQKSIIRGLEENLGQHVTVFNMYFLHGEKSINSRIDGYTWNSGSGKNYNLKFNNAKGIQVFSKYHSLKKNLGNWLKKNNPNGKTQVIVYPAYFPFLMALKSLKRKFDLDVCLVVADLPQYMGLGVRKTVYNKIVFPISMSLYEKNISTVDSFVFLTEHMNEKTNVFGKPYTVMEGIASSFYEYKNLPPYNNPKVVIYSGAIQVKYGIQTYLKAIELVNDENVEFRFYGTGDACKMVDSIAKKDSRVKRCEHLPIKQLNDEQQKCTLLINPRQNNEEFTKYSFPSKNLEYMLSGRPIIAYMLDGIPKEYAEFYVSPKDNSPQALAQAISQVLDMPESKRNEIGAKARQFVLDKKNYLVQTKKIIDLIEK